MLKILFLFLLKKFLFNFNFILVFKLLIKKYFNKINKI